MKVIRANCRYQFTPADYDFIAGVLPSSAGADPRRLFRLFDEPETFDRVLDDPRLYRAVLDLQGCLPVSMQFYFYVLVRHALLKEGIRDPDVADYVAELLAEFASGQRWRQPHPTEARAMDYLHEMLAVLERIEGEKRFEMQAHIGNYALFLAGVFPTYLVRRMERRGAPGFRFYEELGSAHYRMAGGHDLAKRMDLEDVFLTLGETFRLTRLALNNLSENMVFLRTQTAVQKLLGEIGAA
ncbi:MAG TPA: hypothetical protein VK465_18410 [Fibrobacteria bacterium]|nr:hypothetical protein [Fibrobacteria bacterium]